MIWGSERSTWKNIEICNFGILRSYFGKVSCSFIFVFTKSLISGAQNGRNQKKRSGNYLLHFSKVSGLRKGKFLGTVLESILESILETFVCDICVTFV